MYPIRRKFIVLSLVCLSILAGMFAVNAATAKTTIRFMGWGSILEKENVEKAIREFEKQNPDLKIEWIHVPENYNQKLQIMIAGGTPPDVFWLTDLYLDFVARDLLLDITNFVEKDQELGKPDYFLQPQERERMYIGGRAYGIGSCWVSIHMYYNKKLFDQAKVAYPPADPDKAWTWSEFVNVARKLTLDKNGRNALDPKFDRNNIVQYGVDIPTWWLPLIACIWTNGGKFLDETRTKFELDDARTVRILQDIADLKSKYYASPQASVYEQLGMGAWQMLATGKVAMTIDGSWALQDLSKMGFPLGTAVLPRRDRLSRPVTPIQAHLHVIYKGTKYPEAAWRFLKFLSSKDYQRDLCKIGLWLPSQHSLLTPEGKKEWLTPGVHPPEYELVGLKFMEKYGRTLLIPPGGTQAFDIMTQELDPVWIGRRTAKEAVTKMLPQMNKALAEALEAAKKKI